MNRFTVAMLGASIASEIGKEQTSTDVTFFELKKGENSVTMLEPTRYPERLSSLFHATEMAEFVVLVIDEIDATIGETIVMIDTVGVENGWIILRNHIQPEQIIPFIADSVLENYEFKEYDPIKIREDLLELSSEQKKETEEGSRGTFSVYNQFNVRGVGTVALAFVVDGQIQKHDNMKVLPLDREVVLRSIQKHSMDSDSAVKGEHGGMALRGIESDELSKGYVLTTDDEVTMTKKFTGKVKMVKFWEGLLKDGMVMHLGHWMQMIPFRMSMSGDDITFDLNSELIYKPGDKAVLMYLEGKKLRVVGSVIL